MSSYYTKIQYESEGIYGSTETHTLYCHHHNGSDSVTVYDEDGTVLFSYGEWSDKHMGNQLIKLLTSNLPLKEEDHKDGIEYMTPEEFNKIVYGK